MKKDKAHFVAFVGVMFALIFVLFTNYSMFNCFFILLYNLAWVIITIAAQAFRRM